jgi:hypothetical protein
MIRKAENTKSLFGEMLVANAIMQFALRNTMLRTVHLDDQLLTELGEIDDISAHRNLAAEVKSISIEMPQLNPKFYLLRGHRFSQLARS